MLYLLPLHKSLLPKKKKEVFVLLQTFSLKGIVGDHFQISDEFFGSLPSCFTSDLDFMARLCFCF